MQSTQSFYRNDDARLQCNAIFEVVPSVNPDKQPKTLREAFGYPDTDLEDREQYSFLCIDDYRNDKLFFTVYQENGVIFLAASQRLTMDLFENYLRTKGINIQRTIVR